MAEGLSLLLGYCLVREGSYEISGKDGSKRVIEWHRDRTRKTTEDVITGKELYHEENCGCTALINLLGQTVNLAFDEKSPNDKRNYYCKCRVIGCSEEQAKLLEDFLGLKGVVAKEE